MNNYCHICGNLIPGEDTYQERRNEYGFPVITCTECSNENDGDFTDEEGNIKELNFLKERLRNE